MIWKTSGKFKPTKTPYLYAWICRKELEDVKQAIVDAKSEYEYMLEKKVRSEELTKKSILDKKLVDLKAENVR